MLLALILIPFAAAILAWAFARVNVAASRWTALVALVADLALASYLFAGAESEGASRWIAELKWSWFPRFGIQFYLGADAISLVLVMLASIVGFSAVLAAWRETHDRAGAFHLNLLWTIGSVVGAFLSLDLFLFYFFWELMLVPMFLLILVWGHERRVYAGVKFFIYTQLSGLLMLVAILALVFAHARTANELTFSYPQLLGTELGAREGFWIMLGFAAAFAVKLPVVPLHIWAPDAYAEAPTAGSMVLAGVLSKAGAYGLLRFAIPLFPDAAAGVAPVAAALGVAGILYGAFQAFGQQDIKRFVAYVSVSHLGFVLLGLYAWNHTSLQGVVLQLVCHGLSASGLFVAAGILEQRTGVRRMDQLGGLWKIAPRLGAAAMILAMASLGLPGLGNFVAEFLILAGTFQWRIGPAVAATVGLILATIYAVWLIQRIFHGAMDSRWSFSDLRTREVLVFGIVIVCLIGLGLYPKAVLSPVQTALTQTAKPQTESVLMANEQ